MSKDQTSEGQIFMLASGLKLRRRSLKAEVWRTSARGLSPPINSSAAAWCHKFNLRRGARAWQHTAISSCKWERRGLKDRSHQTSSRKPGGWVILRRVSLGVFWGSQMKMEQIYSERGPKTEVMEVAHEARPRQNQPWIWEFGQVVR